MVSVGSNSKLYAFNAAFKDKLLNENPTYNKLLQKHYAQTKQSMPRIQRIRNEIQLPWYGIHILTFNRTNALHSRADMPYR